MSTKKNLTTKQTIDNLAAELKKRFAATDTRLSEVETKALQAFKSGKVDGNTVSFYTSANKSGDPAFSVDLPTEMFLDQTKTQFVPKFTFTEETYPGATNPNLNNKPVMVLAVKGDDGTVTYSFLNMAALVDTYTAKAEGKDGSTTVEINGYEVEVKVNISKEGGNQLQLKDDGLYVGPAKVEGATKGNLVALDENGNLTDSGVPGAKLLNEEDITDYTAEEIAALLGASAE